MPRNQLARKPVLCRSIAFSFVQILVIFGLVNGFSAGFAQEDKIIRACIIDQEPWGSLKTPEHSIYGEAYREISRQAGIQLTISVGPLARSLDDVRSGHCMFMITSWQPARAEKIARGADFADLDYGILPRKGLALADYAALKGKTMAIARGLLIGDPFDHDEEIRKVGVYSYEEAVRMTEAGRADGAVGSIITLLRFARLHGTLDQLGEPLRLAHVPLSLQMYPDFAKTEIAQQLNRAVERLHDDGEAQSIIERYMREASLHTE